MINPLDIFTWLLHSSTYCSLKYSNKIIIGGEISKPLNDQENRAIVEIGDSFYDICEADEQSGKTLWIGIERKGYEWVVSIS